MFIGHGPSGLPEDRVINVFHFSGVGAYASLVDAALENVESFYNGTTAQTNPLGYYLSAWVQRSAELRAYDLDSAIPRTPTIVPFTLAGTPTDGLPEEVAVCLSYHGVPPITPRRRGRIYFGPLRNAACDQANTTTPARPTANLVNDLCAAARTLTLNSTGGAWSVRSSLPTQNFVTINDGYVDNAFDTQIRRGPETTARTNWTSA